MYSSLLKKISKSDFTKNTFVIFFGSVVSQLILIAFTPWLSRLYSPLAFGLYGVFISAGTILGSMITLRFTQAILIADEDSEAHFMVETCIYLSLLFSLVFLLICWLLLPQLLKIFNVESLGNYFLWLPIYAFLLGINESLIIWLNRNKSFKHISINRVLTSSVTIIVSIVLSFFYGNNFVGLIFGGIIGQALGSILLFYNGNRIRKFTMQFNGTKVKSLMYRYRHFPYFTMPSDFTNILTNQLPIFMLNKFFSGAEAGYYNMSNRILGLPSQFVSSAIGEVFRQRASEDYRNTGTCKPIFLKTLSFLAVAGVIPFTLIALFGPQLFSFFLGKAWTNAGFYSRMLALLFCLKFIVSPLTVTFFIAQKQKIDFYGHLLMLIFTAVPFYVGFVVLHSPFYSLLLYVISYSALYLFYLYFSFKFASNEG